MFDSLPFRNDAAAIFRRLIRSLPTRRGVLGVATCDKGLPAMMMALAATRDLPVRADPRRRHACCPPREKTPARIQSIGARYVHGELTLEQAADLGCHACASPGGGCQFLGTAATSQVVGEALGMALGHAALAPSGPSHLAGSWRAARRARCWRWKNAASPCATSSTEAALRQRHGHARGLRRLHQPDSAPARHRPRRRAAPPHWPTIGRASTAACRGWSTLCRTARATMPPCRFSWRAACPR